MPQVYDLVGRGASRNPPSRSIQELRSDNELVFGNVTSQENEMDKSGATIDQVKDGVGAVVDRAREVVNDGLDSVKGTFNDGADNLDRFYRSTVSQVRDTSERISENAREQLDDVKDSARKSYRHARKTLSRLSGDARDYVNDNPGQSLLIAAGIGLLAGLVVHVAAPRPGA